MKEGYAQTSAGGDYAALATHGLKQMIDGIEALAVAARDGERIDRGA